jgi:hypothetical protein
MKPVTDYLHALRQDLRDRRLLPLVVLAGVMMVAAVAFVIVGGSGGGSSSSPTASTGVSPSPPAGETTGLALTHPTTANAVAETTSGTADQHKGSSRDPFAALPTVVAAEAKAAASKTSASSGSSSSSAGTSSGGSSSSESSSGGSSSGGSASGGSPKSGGSSAPNKGSSKKSSKRKTVYQVSVLFGETTVGTSSQSNSGLTPHENLALLAPLPNKEEALVVFRGVTDGGSDATFTVAGETILQGDGKCLPSSSKCEAIELKAGQVEQLQYLKPGTQNVQNYELRVVAITPASASEADLAKVASHRSKAGIEVLQRENLVAIPGLGMSSLAGVLVPTS